MRVFAAGRAPTCDPHALGRLAPPVAAGLDAGSWCPYGEPADWPGDQRAMDGMSLCFTSDPLEERLEILSAREGAFR